MAPDAACFSLQHRGAVRLGCPACGTECRRTGRSGRFRGGGGGCAPPEAALGKSSQEATFDVNSYAAVIPPWSAAHPFANLYGPKAATRSVVATVVGNVRVTEVGREYEHPPHRARFRRRSVPGARRAVDRDRSPWRGWGWTAAPPAPVFNREPTQRRAARLQQRLAHREAGVARTARAARCAASPATTCAT